MFTTFTPTKPFVRIDAKIPVSGGGNDQGVTANIVRDGVVKDAAGSTPNDTSFAMTRYLNGYSGSHLFGGKSKTTLDVPMLNNVNFWQARR